MGNVKSLDPNGVHGIGQEKKRLKEKQPDAHALETNLKDIAKKIADDIELQKQYATCKKRKPRNPAVG